MAATVKERQTPRRLTNTEAQRFYLITGVTDDAAAQETFYAWIVANQFTIGDCVTTPCYSFSYNDSFVEEIEGLPSTYYATAVWKILNLSAQPPNSFSIGFDIAGESQRITHSISTVTSAGSGGDDAPNHQGAINVNEDGSVDGCEIIVPQATYNVTYTFQDSTITTAWLRGVAGVVGKTNNGAFQGFNECELLLSKVSGQQRIDFYWDITFGFAISLNQTGITIGECAPVDKKGWQYLWVQWETAKVDSDLAKQAKAVYVEQVYYEVDYTTLGIPNNWDARL